jgi:hypothetical protein
MNQKAYSQILDNLAREAVPDRTNLAPRILEHIQSEKHARVRSRVVLFAVGVMALTLAVVFTSVPSAVQAARQLFGFIPGVGLVDRAEPIRMLAAPVSDTRLGVTVTIEQVILSSERTVLRYSISGLGAANFTPATPDPNLKTICGGLPYLELPNGRKIEQTGYNAFDGQPGSPQFRQSVSLGAVPAEVDHATLVLPCIDGIQPGQAPENWEIPVTFVPAPENLTMAPVFSVSSTPSASLTGAPTRGFTVTPDFKPGPADGITVSIDTVVYLPEGDILYGSLQWDKTSSYSTLRPQDFSLKDARGQTIPITAISPDPAILPTPGSHSVPLAFQIKQNTPVTGPLTLTLNDLSANLPVKDTRFVLDTGADPHIGQEWLLNRDIAAAGQNLRLLSVVRTRDGYDFRFHTSPQVGCVDLLVAGRNAMRGECGTGHTSLGYDGAIPGGSMTVEIANLEVLLKGSWQATWMP